MMYAQKVLKTWLPLSEKKILLLNAVKVEPLVFLVALLGISETSVKALLL